MSIGTTTDHEALAATVRAWAETAVQGGARRVGIDSEQAVRPPYWEQMVEMGWPVLHSPERYGGQGFAIADLAIVLEETGRAGVTGPLLPTAVAVSILVEAEPSTGRDAALQAIAGGATAAVAFAGAGVDLDPGEHRNVMGAPTADFIVAPCSDGWRLHSRTDVVVHEPTGVDLARPVATVVTSQPGGTPLSVSSQQVVDLASLLLCCEAVGIASWCVDTASQYARTRVQFGRPIGKFQGIKHRCADMLAATELARAATWDACRGGDPDEAHLAITCATAIVADLVVGVAKDCVQVLGGIGFSWEHDAHLYLRRAIASRALLPAAGQSRTEVVSLVKSGIVRQLPVELPPEAETVRPEVRQWLGDLANRPRAEWNHRIANSGYLVPHWPVPWGRGASAVEQVVIDQEFRSAGVRRVHLQVAAWALPTIIAHGTHQQQEQWVGPSLRQEIMWCQLFSEPEAGSDLASLRMKAVRDGDGWRLSGQKVWTSMAHTSDWGICLARTSPDKPNHDGITCFVIDMSSAGLDIRPLREINGDAWFNEVFFDDVFVPDDCVIGAVDDGWRAGRTTLANERVAMGAGASIGAGVTSLVELTNDETSVHVLAEVGELVARDAALNALRMRLTIRSLAGADAGPEASVVKLLGVIHDQDVQEAGLAVLGPSAAAATGTAEQWVTSFLWNRSLTIAGGTSEIQRNVIGERLLGLPRDV